MTFGPGTQFQDQDEQRAQSWVRRLVLLLLIFLGSFGCILLAAQVALLGLEPKPLRDVRSAVRPNYLAGARRAAPLVPLVIEAVKKEVETARPTPDFRVLTVVPVVQIPPATPTIVAQITPTPSATATPRLPAIDTPGPEGPGTPTDTPGPTETRPPTDTPIAVPATPTAVSTASATLQPTEAATPIRSPTAIFTPVSPTTSPSPTVTSVLPTETATPTATPQTPTSTPTAPPSPPDTSTPTPTQPPAASDTPTPTPTPTETPTSTPVLPPDVMSINPNATVQGSGSDPDINVDIVGQHFMGSLAWLGQNIAINVLSVVDTLINGTLSPNIPTGIYALTVENSDGQQDVLQRAFTVHPRSHPTNTLDSDTAFIATFGPVADVTEGDDDYVQIIFFEVPDGPADVLYVRIFDPDTGGAYDETGLDDAFGDTTMTYSLRGGSGAYTVPDARSDHPGPAGIGSGTLIAQTVIGEDPLLDGTWLPWSVTRGQGELVGGSRVFKLVVQGSSGDDGNRYQVAISSDPSNNIAVAGARIFAFSWCAALPSPGDTVNVYPFVPVGASLVTQFNFDFDVSPGSAIDKITPLRNLPVVNLSGNGDVASQGFIPFSGEMDTTWTAHYVTGSVPPITNDFTLWFTTDGATALAVFTAPTLISPP